MHVYKFKPGAVEKFSNNYSATTSQRRRGSIPAEGEGSIVDDKFLSTVPGLNFDNLS